jgi:hypothetical protein
MIADSFVCFPLINLAQNDIVLTFISENSWKENDEPVNKKPFSDGSTSILDLKKSVF